MYCYSIDELNYSEKAVEKCEKCIFAIKTEKNKDEKVYHSIFFVEIIASPKPK